MQRSLSSVDANFIRNHPANNSVSKATHAFSKTKRFQMANPECPRTFYRENLTELSMRKTSFGFGTKSDFTKNKIASPSPTNYNIKSCFESNKQKGPSFGLAREKLENQAYTFPELKKVPGPGRYEDNKSTLSPIKFSIRAKPKDFIEEKLSYKQNPGPGWYESIDLDPKSGRHKIAKFKDSQFGKINPSERFPDKHSTKVNTPSAFDYQEKDGINKEAKYVLSKHKSMGVRAFTHSKRLTFADDCQAASKNMPGPGYYEKPSEFGIYN